MSVFHQRNDRERNTDRQYHLPYDQRLRRILRKPQYNQCRHKRHHAARPHRRFDPQQSMHNFGAGIRADRCGAQAGSQQSNRENRADHRAQSGCDGMLRAFNRISAGHAIQRIRRENQQRQIHRAGQKQRPYHIDLAAMQQRLDVRLLLPRGIMVIDECGMQVNRMRHHRGSQHRSGHEHGRGPFETRDQARCHLRGIRRVDEKTRDEAERDHQQQRDDHLLEKTMRRPLLENQQHRGNRADNAAADEQRQTEQQFQCNRSADHLRQIRGDGDHLSLHEEHEPAGIPQTFAQNLRQTPARDDAEFG